jgi:hypothetical protein
VAADGACLHSAAVAHSPSSCYLSSHSINAIDPAPHRSGRKLWHTKTFSTAKLKHNMREAVLCRNLCIHSALLPHLQV